MTHEEMIRMMQGAQMQHSSTAHIPIEKLNLYIDRVLAEKDETLYSMAQALQWKLQAAPMVSYLELEVLPQVLIQIKKRLEGGEK